MRYIRKKNTSSALQLTTKVGSRGVKGEVNSLKLTNKKIERQIDGFGECLNAFLDSNKIRKSIDQDKHLRDVFRGISMDKLPKVFKMSIAQMFSIYTKQELPDTDGISLNLFSKDQEKRIRKRFNMKRTESKRAAMMFKLLQCKDLANPVPDNMIKESYKKHREVLSTVRKTPEDVLQHVRIFSQQFAKSVKQHYTESIPLALTTAPYECTRSQGGTREYLHDRLTFNKSKRIKTDTRIDPVVLHLTGKPGLGKSFISEMLIGRLAKYFGILKSEARYSRSMACEHWDGYRNQLIAQIDDIFTERNGTEDAKQLIQMCSNAKWIVPMADLREKGREFNSEFLLLSSNNRFGKSMYVNCEEAVDRRVYSPHYEFKSYNSRTKQYVITFKTGWSDTTTPIGGSFDIVGDYRSVVDHMFNYAIKTYNQRINSLEIIDGKSYRKTFMPIINGNNFEFRVGYEFDPCPTTIPVVKAHAIPEPLKVRMITKGEAQNWVLKPLQKAMHKALKDFPCFRLTSGQNILYNFRAPHEGMSFISGDYSAATDNLNSDIMETVVSELIKVLPETIIPYVTREAGSHLIEYPSSAGLEPVLQTNGQLMGSLLSFPILCIANAATYGYATNHFELQSLPCLINGDDISFRDFDKVIKRWKRFSSLMGLMPSVGKNYKSRNWFTINSQFCECSPKSRRVIVNPSLAFNVLWSHKARKGDINTLREASERFKKPDIVKYLKSSLKQTPRSLDISIMHGGLGVIDTRKPTRIDREVNLMNYLKKKTQLIQHIDEYSIVQCTKDIALKYVNFDLIQSGLREGIYPPKRPFACYEDVVPKYRDVLTDPNDQTILRNEFNELHKFQKYYQKIPVLRDWIKSEKPLFNLRSAKLVTIVIYRDVYESFPKHSFL